MRDDLGKMPESRESRPVDRQRGGSYDGSCSNDAAVVDLEAGGEKAQTERDCRICHLSLDAGDHVESGVAFAIELGCSCKDDLAAAHKLCAEAWFKIKGDKTCEICGSTARNVAGANEVEPTARNETNGESAYVEVALAAASRTGRRFWEGHRFLYFLLACIVFAFVVSWLFHCHVPTKY